MPDLIIPSIVEGHGEVKALPVLMRRLLAQLAPNVKYTIRQPIRIPKGSFLNRREERIRAVELAAISAGSPDSSFIIILFDADDSCPAQTAPDLLANCQAIRPDFSIGLTLAKWEFESWFLASAESLRGVRMLPETLERPNNPEDISDGKGWISSHRSDSKYSETVDQPAYSAQFDFEEAREYSPSFDKFYRDFSRLVTPFIQ